MLDSLPDILGKNFLIGFFIPVFIASVYFAAILTVHAVDLEGATAVFRDGRFGLTFVTTAGFLLWVASVLLMAMNRPIIRLLEGYGRLNPLRLLTSLRIRKFRRLRANYERFKQLYDRKRRNEGISEQDREAVSEQQLMEFSSRYAFEERLLLPTAFGNIMRSIEYYPFDVYGIDSIVLWPRLASIQPKALAEIQDEMKSRLDLWINLCVLFFIQFAVALGFLIEAYRDAAVAPSALEVAFSWEFGLIVGAAILSLSSYRRSCTAAQRWGEFFKAAFDSNRPALARSLGYELPEDFQEEKRFWGLTNRKALYGFGVYEEDLRQHFTLAKPEPEPEPDPGGQTRDAA